jgi:hypothetical protein
MMYVHTHPEQTQQERSKSSFPLSLYRILTTQTLFHHPNQQQQQQTRNPA